jgi:hypothetical protein
MAIVVGNALRAKPKVEDANRACGGAKESVVILAGNQCSKNEKETKKNRDGGRETETRRWEEGGDKIHPSSLGAHVGGSIRCYGIRICMLDQDKIFQERLYLI